MRRIILLSLVLLAMRPVDDAPPARRAFRASSPVPQLAATRASGDVVLGDGLSVNERAALSGGLDLLQSCAPSLRDYVGRQIVLITRGTAPENDQGIGYIDPAAHVLYIVPFGDLDNAASPPYRVFMAAANLVHAARHIEMGSAATERDAFAFELQVFTGACYPPGLSSFWLDTFRREVEARSH